MPKIETSLRIQEPLIPGERVDAVLTLIAKKPVTIDWVTWTFEGHERCDESTRDIVTASHRVMGATQLHGTITRPIQFVLPLEIPPTFAHGTAEIRYVLRVDVSIPWAWDPHWSWRLRVGAPHVEDATPHRPVVVRSEDGVELSLDRQRFAPGDRITGRVAWPGSQAPTEIHLGVRERITVQGHVQLGRRLGVTLPLDRTHAAGTPFRFQVPHDLTPGFESRGVSLGWEIYVSRVSSSFDADAHLSAPITILNAHAQQAPIEAAPAVGRARLRDAAARVGDALGWRVDNDALHRSQPFGFSLLQASVQWDQRDRPYLVATIAMPSVMLGLEMRPRSFFDHLDPSSRVLDHASVFGGREPAQVRAFLTLIVDTVKQRALSLVHVSDEQIVVERIDVRGDDASLHDFLANIEALLEVIARAMLAIPPMRDVTVSAVAMRRFAEELHGSFTPGDCSVRGTLPSGHNIHAHVIVPAADAPPVHLEVRLEGLAGSFAIMHERFFMRGNGAVRALAEVLDPSVSIEAEHGEGSAIRTASPGARLAVTPELILGLVEWLFRASQLASGNSIFR